MDDVVEIDLRKILQLLLAQWKLIAIVCLIAGVGSFVFSFLQPRVYKGVAVVAVTRPRYIANFDPRFQTVTNTQLANKIVLDIATSDEIEIAVYNAWQDPDKNRIERADFREKALEAKAGGDLSTTTLTVTLESAEEAARLANYWADLTVNRVNKLYSGQDEGQLLVFETQIENSKTNLSVAENALVNFESRNEIALFTNERNAMLAQQAEVLQKLRLIDEARRDVQGIIDQVSTYGADQVVPGSIWRNFSVLQMRYYATISSSSIVLNQDDMVVNPNVVSPFQLQIGDQVDGEGLTQAAMLELCQSWVTVLDSREAELIALQQDTTDRLLSLQEQIQKMVNERQRLELSQEIAEDTLTTLTRKYQELQVTIDNQAGDAQVAATALPRQKHESRNTALNTMIGIVLGGLLSIVGILALDWWRNNSPNGIK